MATNVSNSGTVAVLVRFKPGTPVCGTSSPRRIFTEVLVTRQRAVLVKVFFVGRNPIRCDLVLSRCQIQFPFADKLMEIVFQGVFDVCVPDSVGVRLGPKVANVV